MNDNSTSSFLLHSDNLLSLALKSVQYGSPSEKTVDFLRNFANSFGFVDELLSETKLR